MMYAVIKSGGKQYRVKQGDTIKVEKLHAEQGADVKIEDVLLIADGENIKVGTPLVDGAAVTATVKSHGRGPKIRIIKMKRRKHYRRQMGHRQSFTELSITDISG
jgi:large subunit ribosomal protein L21